MQIRTYLAFILGTLLAQHVRVLPVQAQPPVPAVPAKASNMRLDGDGEPLPPGAKYRLGTRKWRHRGEGYSLCFSANGKTLGLTSRSSGDVLLMNVATGRVEFVGHPKLKEGALLSATSLAFSPDGQELAFRSIAGSIEIFSADGRKHLRSLTVKLDHHSSMAARSLVYSPDGKYLAVSGEHTFAILDANTGEELGRDEATTDSQGFAFNRDSTQLFVASGNPSLKVWDLRKRKVVKTLSEAEQQFVLGPAVAPNGSTVAVAFMNENSPRPTGVRAVLLVDLKTDKVIHRLKGDDPQELFMEIAITPDGKLVMGASQEGPVYVWNMADGSRKWKLTSDSFGVRSMALSPDGKLVATSDVYHHIWIWSLETGKLLTDKAPGHDDSVGALAFSPEGSTIVTGSGGKDTHVWKVATGQHVRKLETWSSSLAFTSEGNLLSSWVNAPPLQVWNISTGEKIRDVTPSGPSIGYFSLSGDRKQIAILQSPSKQSGCRLLRMDCPSLTPQEEMSSPGYHVGCVAISAGGDIAAIAGALVIEIWDLREGKLLGTLSGHSHQPKGLVFTPDGRFLISGSLDKSVRVWELATCKPVFALQGHKRSLAAIALAPNGRVVASAGGSRSVAVEVDTPQQIRFWDIATGEQIASLSGHNQDVSSLAFSPDGKLLAAGMRDTTALVWDVPAVANVRGFPAQPLTAIEAAKLWDDLASPDASQAQKALVRLARDPKTAVSLAENKLPPIVAPPAKTIQAAIQELDSDAFAKREAAMQQLAAYGSTVSSYLAEAVEKSESTEIRGRCKELLVRAARKLDQSGSMLQQTRGVQLLEWLDVPEAFELLKKLAKGASEAHQTKEAQAALSRMQK